MRKPVFNHSAIKIEKKKLEDVFNELKNKDEKIQNNTYIQKTKYGCMTVVLSDLEYANYEIEQINKQKNDLVEDIQHKKYNECTEDGAIDIYKSMYEIVNEHKFSNNYDYTEFLQYFKDNKLMQYINMYYYVQIQRTIQWFNNHTDSRAVQLKCKCGNTVVKSIRYLNENQRPHYCGENCLIKIEKQQRKEYDQLYGKDRTNTWFNTLYINSKNDTLLNDRIVKRIYNCTCHLCRNNYDVLAQDFLSQDGYDPRAKCPICSDKYKISHSEWEVIEVLDNWGITAISQLEFIIPEKDRLNFGNIDKFHVDIAVFNDKSKTTPTHIIEVNGQQHYIPNSSEQYNMNTLHIQQKRDLYIKQYCLNNNIEFIEINNLQTRSASSILSSFGINRQY